MKNPRILPLLIVLFSFSALLSACESLSKMAKNHATMSKYTVTPDPLEEHGDKINISLKGEYQPKFFNKSAILVIQPSLVYSGGSVDLKPIILRGEKVQGEGVLISNANGGNFTLTDVIDYKPEMFSAELVLNPIAYTAKAAKETKVTNAAEAKSVPKSLAFGDQNLAPGTMATATRINLNGTLTSVDPDRYQKESFITEKATIFYIVDLSDLNWKAPFNKLQNSMNAIDSLTKALGGENEISSVMIASWASPEGEEARNQNLSSNRSKTASKYLTDNYNKVIAKKEKDLKLKRGSLKQTLNITAESKGEDWEGFLTALRNSNIPEKNTIINVISSNTTQESRNQEIRNMGVIYKQIEDSILPALRRSEINVVFKEKKKTDEQIAALSLNSPDSLSLEELLFSTTLTENIDDKLKIYLSTTRIYPEDYRAYLNASSIYIQEGNYEDAQLLLEQANSIEPNNPNVLNNLGVIALSKGDFENAKANFQNSGNAQAISNLGILSIKEGNYAAAVSTLTESKCTYNLGLAQLMNKDYASANTTLNCMDPKTGESYYLEAVCAAREGNAATLYKALQEAIKVDKKWAQQAQKDVEFLKFQNTPEFIEIIK